MPERILIIPENKFYGTEERDTFNDYSRKMHEKHPKIVIDGTDMPSEEGVRLRIHASNENVLGRLTQKTIEIFKLEEREK